MANVNRQADPAMAAIKQPSKEQVREWLASRWRTSVPVPDIDQIRQQLGWVTNVHGPVTRHQPGHPK
jgi:hypothetical protein